MKPPRIVLAILLVVPMLALVLAGSAAAATTITFQEPEKGSTFNVVDNAPHSKFVNGGPKVFSPGDEIIIGQPLTQGGERIGRLRAICTASATGHTFAKAEFLCQGAFVLPEGMMFGFATLDSRTTKGVITGGTGAYADGRGTFVSKERKGGKETTITLAE